MTSSSYTPAPAADFVLPFDLPGMGLRGRLVRLDAVSTRALSSHPLPEPAQRVLAEALGLSALLGSALKLEGRLSVQLKGDGPLNLLATDYFAGGGLRGYARVDEERYGALVQPAGFAGLAGKGAFALTLEPQRGAQTYQGLVPLADSLAASAETYFTQSEQLPTLLKLAAGPIYRSGEGRGWRAGGVMIQATPERVEADVLSSDDWHRVSLFLQTLEDVELLDTSAAAESVLWRLFHEDEVRVHPSQPLAFECTCSGDKVRAVLASYPAEELRDVADADGIIRTRCEFCGTAYEFTPDTLGAETGSG